ncbi:type II toxin-antitoxin system RelE/ParE family toxin [Aquirufa aurantiipilula]|uniref:Type II toxin-antitoxin system RelE/ParE family toxin n=1 Tax=Aquirufa aurantiipilula TaxID=2696561 RepID=A0ABT6BKR9_9BACT|nr:type II toxin-antitoxin system RelE/ParE family toxin [Aquirufa aurantiipilula]MBZ1327457.1 type II toxin-antitoxin system RelE/ParE family toxin [Aquirufa aurantiipilula]MDF5691073.1 type II toxin-antitoxin system RelE/ParE family toxin [Aquirufa aurantiipilula]
METVRQIIFYKDYFHDFFNDQTEKVKEKIDYVLYVITVAERVPKKFFDHIEGTDGLYEIRVEFQSNIFRIFCCFDEGKVVILFNGFQKKSQKTPPAEIERALKIKAEYVEEIKSRKR